MVELDFQIPFALVPLEVAHDDRLTLRHIRVLLALLACRNRRTNLIFPTREKLSDMTGIDLRRISVVTGELVKLGWLEKKGNGGRSSPVHYKFLVPESITESTRLSLVKKKARAAESKLESVADGFEDATVTDLVTVTESVTVTDLVTKTVTDLVTGKEQTTEQTNTTTSPARAKKPEMIGHDWGPSERCKNLILSKNISLDFALGLVGEFVMYWQDAGEKRKSWDSTFFNHVKRESERGEKVSYASSRAVGRKLSLVEQADADIERFEASQRRRAASAGATGYCASVAAHDQHFWS